MKVSEKWLRSWVDPPVPAQQIADRLVMAGLELEIEPALEEIPSGVVVGRIVAIAPHPHAERLRVCEVDAGGGAHRTIVCGAPNARLGLTAPCALPGARLPGGVKIGVTSLRGVESAGMLCSAKELGLSEQAEGLLELDAHAQPGTPIEDHLDLDDRILHLELTPNRGDCLSVLGLAREIGALFEMPPAVPPEPAIEIASDARLNVGIEDPADCSAFAGRVIGGLNPQAVTPDWLRERLRRSGIRAIHPLVDITNYVMLELGQPMHAYDADKLRGRVHARRARAGERLTLLNGQQIGLSDELIIADDSGPLGLAGAMGGAASAVSAATRCVFFESAAFTMDAVAGVGRRHKLSSDALHRFERGVDPALQQYALARATELALAICGGRAGPLSFAGVATPEPVVVALRHARLNRLLGVTLDAATVTPLLARLSITSDPAAGGWHCRVPSFRPDLRLEVDLIEEVARLYGYDRIPASAYAVQIPPSRPTETQRPLAALRAELVARGWSESVNLAFADLRVQTVLNPGTPAVPVDNPLAETLAVLRTTLWTGLLANWLHNRARQMPRARLFEAGVCFADVGDKPVETARLAGLAAGTALPEQWAAAARAVDFYDVKAEVEALLARVPGRVAFRAAAHPALHPGQCAEVLVDGAVIGVLGRLHPRAAQLLDLPESPLLFELDIAALTQARLPRVLPVPEYPSSRRDLAVVVREDIPAQALCAAAEAAAGALLERAFVFDCYRGPELPQNAKSLALGLIFQNRARTLSDSEVDAAVAQVAAALKQRYGAELRS